MIFNFQIPYSTQAFYIINFHHYVLFFLILVIVIVTWKLVGLKQFTVKERHFLTVPQGSTSLSMYMYKYYPQSWSDYESDVLPLTPRTGLFSRQARRELIRSNFMVDSIILNSVKWLIIRLLHFVDDLVGAVLKFAILKHLGYYQKNEIVDSLIQYLYSYKGSLFDSESLEFYFRFHTDRKLRRDLFAQARLLNKQQQQVFSFGNLSEYLLYLTWYVNPAFSFVVRKERIVSYYDVAPLFLVLHVLKKRSKPFYAFRKRIFRSRVVERGLFATTWPTLSFNKGFYTKDNDELLRAAILLSSGSEKAVERYFRVYKGRTPTGGTDLGFVFEFIDFTKFLVLVLIQCYTLLRSMVETNPILLSGNITGTFIDNRLGSVNLASVLVRRNDAWGRTDYYNMKQYNYFYAKRALLFFEHDKNLQTKFLLKSLSFLTSAVYVGWSKHYSKQLNKLEKTEWFPSDKVKTLHPTMDGSRKMLRRYLIRKSTDLRKKIVKRKKPSKYSTRTNNIDIVILFYFYSKLLLFTRNSQAIKNNKKRYFTYDNVAQDRIPILKKLYLKKVNGLVQNVFRKAKKYYFPHVNRTKYWMPIFESLSSYSDLNIFASPVELDFFMAKHDDLIFDSYLFTRNFKDNHVLELVWAFIPSIILSLILIPSLITMLLVDKPHGSEKMFFTVKAIGHQWYWSYDVAAMLDGQFVFYDFDSYLVHEDDLQLPDVNNVSAKPVYRLLEVDGRLSIPSQTYVRVVVTSADVIHSWAVPSLGAKVDAVPGRSNQLYIYALSDGIFYGQCSELCGVNHGFMPIVVETKDLSFIRYDLLLRLKNN